MVNRKTILACGATCLVALAVACGNHNQTPVSPSGAAQSDAAAGPSGETLKATAPTAVSPVNNVQLEPGDVKLVITNSTTPYASGVPLTYRFQIMNESGQKVYEGTSPPGGNGQTSHIVTDPLDPEKPFTWRARAEYSGAGGPFSAAATFRSSVGSGWIRGNELYDPLNNGKTVGSTAGSVTWLPGTGVRLNNFDSHITYQLQQTLTEGEYSMIVTNVASNSEGGKTKIMSMGQGYDDIITNDRRMTVEKRGYPWGMVSWRFITHDDQVDCIGAERMIRNFYADRTYLWEATWRNNFFRVRIIEGVPNGKVIYDFGKHFSGGPYDPHPHVVYVGAPIGRSGADGASVPDMVARQVWVSSRPRPAFANK